MADRVKWTASMDERLRTWRLSGATWDAISAAFGLGRETVRERGRRICAARSMPTLPRGDAGRSDRPPLPPGHEISWGLLTSGTILEGEAYPLPWFN
jgi:hypothetical protein